jgi:hypothetical protein
MARGRPRNPALSRLRDGSNTTPARALRGRQETNVSDEPLDWIALAGKRAKGKRPDYFDDPAVDRLLSIVMALVGEVSVQRQRGDTLERLLEAKGIVTRDEIEGYVPDRDAAEERGVATKAYIARVMRGVQQAMEAMAVEEKPVEQVSQELKEL